ncbi:MULTISPECIES: hypothetical protein [unclassified Gluconobacter]|uniref:hypothetical protein n=1 Tax=unclassified Gluconobacter TaxID=2644261 RepID=UPI001924FB5D|nr:MULTISPECIES: hypothetical protein [unclassified Gluconobacter]
MLTNRSYDSGSFCQDLLVHGILPVIPSRKGRITTRYTEKRKYRVSLLPPDITDFHGLVFSETT